MENDGSAAPESPFEERVFPFAAVMAAGTAVAAVTSLFLRIADVVATPGLTRIGALTMITAGVLIVGSNTIHIGGGYCQHDSDLADWTANKRRWLTGLVAASLITGLALIGAGAVFFFAEPHPWRQFLTASVAIPVVWAIYSYSLELAQQGGLDRGTELVRSWTIVKCLRRKTRQMLSVPGIKHIDGLLWVWKTPPSEFSSLAIAILASLLFVFATSGIAVSPEVLDYLSRSHGSAEDKTTEGKNGNTWTGPKGAGTRRVSGKRTSNGSATGKANAKRSSVSGYTGSATKKPTYEDLCRLAAVEPGDEIPGAERSEINGVWHAVGAPTAGCAQRAEHVSGTQDVYAVRGLCNGEFRALGVVSPQHPAAILLDRPALFAREMLNTGKLRGASARVRIGHGDFQIIYTTDGPHMFIRQQTTDGDGGLGSAPARCEDVKPGGGRYVELAPALVTLWLRLGALRSRTWPARDISRDTETRRAYSFYSDTGDRETVAHAYCTSTPPQSCELRANALKISAIGAEATDVDAERVLRLGPRG